MEIEAVEASAGREEARYAKNRSHFGWEIEKMHGGVIEFVMAC
jgi:hypothetical protein